jgi:hypothetical protein
VSAVTYFRSNASSNFRPTAERPERVLSVGNAVAWARAEASLALHGPVAPEILQARTAACRACPELATETEPRDAIGFCKACGCGTGARAALSVKLTMPAATCPKSKW